jgi:drug/metabolite transporter (DMT)-like permease
MTTAKTMGASEWATLFLLSILWGGSFFFIEVALEGLPPFTLVLLRVGLAAALLYAILRLRGGRLSADPLLWRDLFSMALLNNVVPFSLFAWGQSEIAGGLASILNATTPLWAVIVAHLLTDEKATAGRVVGVVLGFGGVVLMIGGDALAGVGADVLAQIACLGATLSYALAGLYGRRFKAMGLPPLAAATGQLAAAAVVLLPVAILADAPWGAAPAPRVWAAVAGLVLLSTAVAYILYFRLLASAGPTNLMLVTFLIPATAILLGWLVLGEALGTQHFLGLAFIGAGLAAIDGRAPMAVRRRLLAAN